MAMALGVVSRGTWYASIFCHRDWLVTHSATVYYSALAVYLLIGLGLGLLLRTPPLAVPGRETGKTQNIEVK